MSEREKRLRVLAGEVEHVEPMAVSALTAAVVPTSPLAVTDVSDRFKVVLAHSSKWYRPRGVTPTSVVIHCTAADNPAASTAAYFASSAPSGSTHAIADGTEGYTMVPDDGVAAGAPPLNQEGLHLEQPGLATWTRTQWLGRDAQLRRVAYHVAEWCRAYGIPVRLLHARDLAQTGEGTRGITYHGAVSEAFHQSTHTDPGPNYPWDVVMGYVQGYYEGDEDMAILTDDQQQQLQGLLRRFQKLGEPAADAPGKVKEGFKFTDDRLDEALTNPKAGSGVLQNHKHVPGGVQAAAP